MSNDLPVGVTGERPSRPDPAVLSQAATALAERIGTAALPDWVVRRRIERPRSTIFVIKVPRSDGSIEAFYKIPYLALRPTDDPATVANRVREHRRTIQASAALGTPVARAVANKPVNFHAPLFADPDRLVTVELAIPGQALGKACLRYLRPQVSNGEEVYRMIGETLFLIEEAAQAPDAASTHISVRQDYTRQLQRSARHLGSHYLEVCTEWTSAVLDEVQQQHEPVLTHGDVSQTNVLVDDRGRIGLIDFSWAPRLPGYDLAHFVFRIQSETPRVPTWTRKAVQATMRGYGVDPTDPPAYWKLAYLRHLIRQSRSRYPRARARAQKGLERFLFDR